MAYPPNYAAPTPSNLGRKDQSRPNLPVTANRATHSRKIRHMSTKKSCDHYQNPSNSSG
jgi:hypothetical protein